MQGTLSPGVLPGLLRDLYLGRKTGLVHFTRAEERRSVGFRRGHISHASTNLAADHLGETLVRLGRLSQADHARCDELMRREEKRLGQALLELGLMTKEQVEESLVLHVREVLLRVFAWDQGSYSFEEQPEQPAGDEDVSQRLSTGEMILEAVRRVQDPDVVRYALGEMDRVLALSSDPLLRFQKIMLSPVDGFLLSRVDGTLSAREVIALAPVSAHETEKSLFGLLCTGVVEFLPGPPKPQRVQVPTGYFDLRKLPGFQKPAAEPAPSPSAPQPPVVPTAPPPPATEKPAGTATQRFIRRLTERFRKPAAHQEVPGAPPTPPPKDGEKEKAVQARRQEILAMAEGLKTKNHFEVLDVPRASSEAQLKDAYFKLARRFHPDTQHDAALKDLAGPIEAIFIRIGQAYDVLRNPRTRASYEERLGPSRVMPPAGGATPVAQSPLQTTPAAAPEPPKVSPPSPTGPQVIELAIRQAERALAQEKYWDVIQAIEPHLAEAKGRLKTRAQLVIAKAYLKNPKWVKQAEAELQKLVQAEPGNVDALLLLAGIYKGSGLKARAASMFRKVLEVQPDHEDAANALAELGAGPSEGIPTPPSGGSFLKKLFKKN